MSKRKLLLADDSITIQKVVNLTFADEGIEVIAVGDGDSALRKFDEFMPDLVMADVNMPGKNGYEVCRLIKFTEETRHIPVILLVGSFEPFDENEAKEAGADDFLTKPFQSIRQLVNKVTDLLNRDVSAGQTSETESQTAPSVDTYAETLEFEKQPETSDEYGDAGMDDEMIETTPATEYMPVSELESQTETPDDYGKTQPLNADELQSFGMAAGVTAEQETRGEAFEEPEQVAETPEYRSEPASFDEEARKLGGSHTYEEATEERPEISETEPQIDYYLPVEGEEFEKEISDAETLEPEVSYAPAESREADLSQAETVGETDAEETSETREEIYEPSLAEETRIRETEEGAEAMPEAEIDLSGAGETQEPEKAETEQEFETAAEMPISAATNVPPINFDDGDLLELPPLVEETGIRPQPKLQPVIADPEPVVEETPSETTELPTEAQAETTEAQPVAESSASPQAFPPELIEAIAQKIADKISAQTMSEVLPQITELVMKKMAEENQEGKN